MKIDTFYSVTHLIKNGSCISALFCSRCQLYSSLLTPDTPSTVVLYILYRDT